MAAALLVGVPVAALELTSGSAQALTVLTVSNNANSGAGSLRQAFVDASSGGSAQAGDVEIDIPVGVGTITLTTGELLYDGGSGSHALTLRGGGNTVQQTTANARVINDTALSLFTMDGLIIAGGHAPSGEAGGGIRVQGSATITNSTITGNSTTDSAGGVRVSNGPLILTNSTISGNTAAGDSGGAYVNGSATITNSTISGNTASSGAGAGINVVGARASLTNSTVSGNTSAASGGGISAQGVTLVYATVVANSSPVSGGANVDTNGGGLTSFGSVIASPLGGGTNCSVPTVATSDGFNLEDDALASCGFSTGTGDLTPGTSTGLGLLMNNGGSTQTMRPHAGSALVGAIPAGSCQASIAAGIATDQIGTDRPQGLGCDIGAFEVPVAPTSIDHPPVTSPPTSGSGTTPLVPPVIAAAKFTG